MLTGQSQVIRELGLSPDDYVKDGEEAHLHASHESSIQHKPTKDSVELPTSSVGQQISQEAQLIRGI